MRDGLIAALIVVAADGCWSSGQQWADEGTGPFEVDGRRDLAGSDVPPPDVVGVDSSDPDDADPFDTSDETALGEEGDAEFEEAFDDGSGEFPYTCPPDAYEAVNGAACEGPLGDCPAGAHYCCSCGPAGWGACCATVPCGPMAPGYEDECWELRTEGDRSLCVFPGDEYRCPREKPWCCEHYEFGTWIACADHEMLRWYCTLQW